MEREMRTLLSALILSLGAITSAQAEELSAATGAKSSAVVYFEK
jgi:hypothetical protein